MHTFANGQRGAPLVAQNVQADAAVGVDVGVVDTGGEVDLGRLEGVVGREVDGEEEDTAGVWGLALFIMVSQALANLRTRRSEARFWARKRVSASPRCRRILPTSHLCLESGGNTHRTHNRSLPVELFTSVSRVLNSHDRSLRRGIRSNTVMTCVPATCVHQSGGKVMPTRSSPTGPAEQEEGGSLQRKSQHRYSGKRGDALKKTFGVVTGAGIVGHRRTPLTSAPPDVLGVQLDPSGLG